MTRELFTELEELCFEWEDLFNKQTVSFIHLEILEKYDLLLKTGEVNWDELERLEKKCS